MSKAAIPSQRGSFYGSYAIPTLQRDKRRKLPRLRECIRCIAQSNDPEYLSPPDSDEFVVVDTVTKEKSWLEIPAGATPDTLTELIEGSFAAPALQVSPWFWVV